MDKFRNEIEQSIKKLTDKGKILFAILTCEKLYPNYVVFSGKQNWGNPEVLKEGISLIYQVIIKDDLFNEHEIKDIINSLNLVTPDTEDFESILVSFALDACTSLFSTLHYMINKDPEYILDVATYARDTVDMYIQEKDDMNSLDPSIDIQIEHDDFMIQEKQRQRDLITRLSNTSLDNITDDLIDSLRDKRPIIDLSLISE
jgi:uncharacterized protein YjaG (DUF416 family)